MVNIKDIFATLGEILVIACMIFGFKISFIKNSDTPTSIVGCILMSMGLVMILKIFHLF